MSKKPYSVILKMNEREYKAKGETLLEAIRGLKADEFKTSGLLIALKGELRAERKFPRVFQLKRLLNNKVLQIIVAKNMEMMMK